MSEPAGVAAWIGLGGNLDDPRAHLMAAFADLAALPVTQLIQTSALYQSAPWGGIEQPVFVNAVARLQTQLAPRELLEGLLEIERRHGRVRDGQRWGPRTLDLDLLMHGESIIHEDGLEVPHPQLAQRAFVLVPLAQIAPQWRVPGAGTVAELLARVDASQCVPLDSA